MKETSNELGDNYEEQSNREQNNELEITVEKTLEEIWPYRIAISDKDQPFMQFNIDKKGQVYLSLNDEYIKEFQLENTERIVANINMQKLKNSIANQFGDNIRAIIENVLLFQNMGLEYTENQKRYECGYEMKIPDKWRNKNFHITYNVIKNDIMNAKVKITEHKRCFNNCCSCCSLCNFKYKNEILLRN